jgi:hypothetical protein
MRKHMSVRDKSNVAFPGNFWYSPGLRHTQENFSSEEYHHVRAPLKQLMVRWRTNPREKLSDEQLQRNIAAR